MGEDWQALALHVRSLDVVRVTTFLKTALKSPSSNYRIVQRSMEEFCFSQVCLSCVRSLASVPIPSTA